MAERTSERPSPAPNEGPTRRPFWISLALVFVWLIAGMFLGSFTGQLSSVQENDNAAFLPAKAESTQVLDLQEQFESTPEVPLLVVVSNPDGGALTQQQVAATRAWMQTIPTMELPEGTTIEDFAVGPPVGPIPSEDGEALLIQVGLDDEKSADPFDDGTSPVLNVTQVLRESAAEALPTLQVNVTGPGGILADFIEVFGEIDTTLLGATALVVAIILILVYRSPFLWLLPILSAGIALGAASGVIYGLVTGGVLEINGQSQGILFVLVFGAGTDYALLLISRYREELHNYDNRFTAMKKAWRGTVEPIVASGATVSIGLLCLLFSELNSNKGTGPVAAIGVVSAVIVTLTFLPALLVVFPRGIFWPKVPRHDDVDEKLTGIWSRVARVVGQRPRATWVATTIALGIMVLFVPTLEADGISQTDSFTKEVDSVVGQEVLTEHFPAGEGSPAVIIGNATTAEALAQTIADTDGVDSVLPYTGVEASPDASAPPPDPVIVDGLIQFEATLNDPADSLAAEQTVQRLRDNVATVESANAKVGGFTAINFDTQQSSQRDNRVIIPIVLAVILVILAMLLRALVIPVILVATVVLSYLATLGVCALVFRHVFNFAGEDSSFPLFAFVFLVALGIDYNIFLMTRVREESNKLGTRPGILRGLTVTGGVITSAGIVLAATFSVLGVLPLVFLAQLGFAVAFGVLLDTFVVRSLLVPAFSYDVGRAIWWPSQLARREDE